MSDFVVIVMICDVSERHIIRDIKNNTHKKNDAKYKAKECRLHAKIAGLHLNWCAAVEVEKASDFLELIAQLLSQ